MGTLVRIVLYAPDRPTARRGAEAAFARIEELESSMSHFRSESEVSRLSQQSGGPPTKASPEVYNLLEKAVHFSGLTDGAFDVTVGPLVALWKEARRTRQRPDSRRIEEAKRLTGYRGIGLDRTKRLVSLKRKGMKLDLSAIAKGMAADEALKTLRKLELPQALVDAGGDIAVGDKPPGRDGWNVAVQSGRQGATPGRRLVLSNAAVATSGDAYQFVVLDGVRYSHIIDPRTGMAVTEASSATVLAPDCLTADALATALCVLRPEEWLRILRNVRGAEACLVRNAGGRRREFFSSGFPPP
jgi:thiamine biosynthesis lipoprotein